MPPSWDTAAILCNILPSPALLSFSHGGCGPRPTCLLPRSPPRVGAPVHESVDLGHLLIGNLSHFNSTVAELGYSSLLVRTIVFIPSFVMDHFSGITAFFAFSCSQFDYRFLPELSQTSEINNRTGLGPALQVSVPFLRVFPFPEHSPGSRGWRCPSSAHLW